MKRVAKTAVFVCGFSFGKRRDGPRRRQKPPAPRNGVRIRRCKWKHAKNRGPRHQVTRYRLEIAHIARASVCATRPFSPQQLGGTGVPPVEEHGPEGHATNHGQDAHATGRGTAVSGQREFAGAKKANNGRKGLTNDGYCASLF